VASNSFGFAVGDVFGVGFARGVVEGYFAAVGGGDGVVEHLPVFCVGDGSGCGGFDVEVVEAKVVEGSVGVGADVEGLFCATGLDVPDVDVGEVRETFFGWGDRGG